MFIELTDHLRCPAAHPEAFLVLLPARVERRHVVAGHLGCPVCGWSTEWDGTVPRFGERWDSSGAPPFDASAVKAFLGIDGPGGWVALCGNAGALADALSPLLPGVMLAAINPPSGSATNEDVSVLDGDAWPLKSHSMRGAVIGSDAAFWSEQAVASVLPGLRCVGVGFPPPSATVVAQADGVWVAAHR